MFKPASVKDIFDIETMSLSELNERLVIINKELDNLSRGCVPKHLCAATIKKHEEQKRGVEAQIEKVQTPSVLGPNTMNTPS